MRTLYLCRHAKSSWANAGASDHARPLNDRGLRDAPDMAKRFAARAEPIDLIVSSDAARALATAKAYAEALGTPLHDIILEPALYHATPATIARVAAGLPASARRAMLFGHNPGMSEAVEYFTDTSLGELPTCAVVRIDFTAADWMGTGSGTGNLVWHAWPKLFE
jgi:phosphohistidine phosphatase